MRGRRLCAAAALVLLLPPGAEAAGSGRGWLAWLEELSGPGPFIGGMVSVPVTCWDDAGKVHHNCLRTIPSKIKKTVSMNGGVLTSGSRARFGAPYLISDPGENDDSVKVVPLFATYSVNYEPFEIGTGGGVMMFFGTGVSASARVMLTPLTFSWKVFRVDALHSNFAIEAQTYYIAPGFNGTSFASTNNGYSSPPELRTSIGFSFSYGAR